MRHLLRGWPAAALLLPWRPCLAGMGKVKRVIVRENRTPDNLFHDLPRFLPAADIADRGVDSHGRIVELAPIQLGGTYDLDHSHAAEVPRRQRALWSADRRRIGKYLWCYGRRRERRRYRVRTDAAARRQEDE